MKKPTHFISIIIFSFLTYCGYSQCVSSEGVDCCSQNKIRAYQRLKSVDKKAIDYQYDVKYLRFDLNINPNISNISGSVYTLFTLNNNKEDFIKMELNKSFTVDSVKFSGENVTFNHSAPYHLKIFIPTKLKDVELNSVEVFYHGNPQAGGGFGSWGKDFHGSDNIPVVWTLSEPYGCRDWWPGKNDLIDKADSLDFIVHCPKQYRAASNGVLIKDEVINDTRTCAWKHRFPVASYLIAVAVTNYDYYSDFANVDGKQLEILNYVYPEEVSEIKPKTEKTVPIMELFSSLFIPYPFINEKYGHAQFGWGGGMEHQTMSFMGGFDVGLIAHELAHQWFGDYITTGSWQDVWLNEGFATYLTGLTYENLYSQSLWNNWKSYAINKVVSLPYGSVYVTDTNSVNRIFDSRLSYNKAALLLHMLRWELGDSQFFAAINNYLNDPNLKLSFARTKHLKNHFENVAGYDLTEFFNDWYYGEGYPTYKIDVSQLNETKYQFTIHQKQSHSSVSFFEMKVPILCNGNNKDTIIVLKNTENDQTFEVNLDFKINKIVLDPDRWLITKPYTAYVKVNEHNLASSEINVFPNPVSSSFITIESQNKIIDKVIIFNLLGKIELEKDCNKQNKIDIDINSLKSGIYNILVYANKGVIAKKLVKI